MTDEIDARATALYERATRGDAGALDELLESYLPRLRAFVRARLGPQLRRRESSADVVQSVCRELIAHRSRFEFHGETQFRGWLFTAAHHKLVEKHRFHRMGKRDIEREVAADGSSSDDGALGRAYAEVASPSGAAIARELEQRFEAAFDRLPDDQREVVSLAKFARLPHAEIAERMERSVGAVRQLLGRALLRLSSELESQG